MGTQGSPYVITGNTGEVTVKDTAGVLCKVIFQAALTGTCTIADGATTINVWPIATIAGVIPYDMAVSTSILVTLTEMADHVVVIYQ